MFFCDYKTNAIPFFISFSLLPLDLLYFKPVAIVTHDVSNNISPPQLSKLCKYQHIIHSYNSRWSTSGNFFLEFSRKNKQNIFFQGTVLESGIAYLRNFVKCLKRNLNATFTIRSFRKSWRQMNILIYRIWMRLENRTYYICIIFPASHVICSIFEFSYEVCFFVLPKYYNGQRSIVITIISIIPFLFLCFSVSFSDSYFILSFESFFYILQNNI